MNRKSAKAMNGSGKGSGRVPVTLRLPEEIVKKIDEDLDHRDVPVSRNNWLLEAAVEKLRKKNQGGRSYGAK